MPRRAETIKERAVDVVVVCALELEAAPLVRRLRRPRSTTGSGFQVTVGTLAGRRVAVARISSDRSRLASAADALVFVHRPRWLVSAGFAVGLSDEVRAGDVLVASELADDQGKSLTVEHPTLGDRARSGSLRIGRLVSVARLPHSAAGKRDWGDRTGALAADRQSFTLARLCSERGTKFLAVRIVSEEAGCDAEPGTRAVYHPSPSYRAGGMVGALLGGAGRAGRLLKLRGRAKRHAERLAEVLAELLSRLP